MSFFRPFLDNRLFVKFDCCGLNCRIRQISKIFTITGNFRTHGNLEMASEVGDEDGLDGKHEGQRALYKNQPTTGPVISRKRKNNDDSAKKIVEIMKANANFRKEKFEQKHAIPQFDETDMFYLSMAKIAKRLPSTDQARSRMEVCRMVSEAEIKQMEMGTPSSVIYPNQSSYCNRPTDVQTLDAFYCRRVVTFHCELSF
jgi:hypothetical protein